MKTFKLDPLGFKKARQKSLLRTIPIMLLATFAGIYISSIDQTNQTSSTSTVNVLPFVIPIIILAAGFGLFLGLKRQKKQWDSYELTIDGDNIIRIQQNVPTVSIKKENLKEIIETPIGDILIKTGLRANFINIPSSVHGREELLKILADFGQILSQPAGNINKLNIIMPIGVIVLMIVFYSSKEIMILIPTGIILFAGLLWSFIEIRKSKHIDKNTKRASYFVFLVLLPIIAKLLIALKVF